MHPKGLERLRIAVVRRAAQDYLEALRVLHKYKDDSTKKYYCSTAENTRVQCENFFLEELDYFMDINGFMLMDTLREKSYDPHFRIRGEGEDI